MIVELVFLSYFLLWGFYLGTPVWLVAAGRVLMADAELGDVARTWLAPWAVRFAVPWRALVCTQEALLAPLHDDERLVLIGMVAVCSFTFLVYNWYVFLADISVDRTWSLFTDADYFWDHIFEYFPIKTHFVDEEAFKNDFKNKPEDRQYIFGVHPHGVFGFNTYTLIVGSQRPSWLRSLKVRILGATAILRVPVLGEQSRWIGIVSASRHCADKFLRTKHSLAILVGGSLESFGFEPEPADVKLVVKRRRGFVRLALKHGVSIVPVMSFGQVDVYKKSNAFEAFRAWVLRTQRVLLLLFYGRFGSMIPFKRPIDVVYGRPIRVERNKEPTEEQVSELLDEYMASLTKIYDDYKDRFGYSKRKLVIT